MSEVVKYLQSYEENFWHYEDAGKVIAIPNGKTIGYSKLILSEIIPLLAPQGLPRFGSLLLAMIATNPHGEKTLDHVLEILNIESKSLLDVLEANAENSGEYDEGIRFAKLLTKLPKQYKKGNLRIELLRGIFQNSHNSTGKIRSELIQLELEKNHDIHHYPTILTKKLLPSKSPYYDFKTLGLIGRELRSVQAIITRLSNLPAFEEVFETLDFEKQQDSSNEDGLIENLIKDQSTFHVGSLVSRLMSGLNIPFHSSLPSAQPLGGVADITNKGNFDKLLISEFAFDDVILMSRLANNESLYKHREVPPSDNEYNRVVLIDITLKNWGAVRTISFASMLAITQHPKSTNPCRVFLIGKSYLEIPFETTSDIAEAMLVMDSSLDPGVGLMKLFTEEQIEVSEIFFIGNQEALNQPTMQLFSAEYGKRIDHWIHPTAEGAITVYKNPKRGKRFIQELKVPLDEAWKNSSRPPRERNTEHVYPILFPNGNKRNSIWCGKDFSYVSTKSRALFRYYGSKGVNLHSGLEMIDSNFPNTHLLKAVMTHDDLSVTLLVAEPGKMYSLIWLDTGKKVPIESEFKMDNYWNYFVKNGCFIGGAPLFSYVIRLDGSVSKKKSGINVKNRNPPISYEKQIYRNLKQVVISQNGRLRFGKHELSCLNGYFRIQMSTDTPNSSKITANSSSPELFTFNDGSYIQHNRNGMLTLVSSNNELPKIFIPCVLNSALGVATDSIFSGERYYRIEPREELVFTEARFTSKETVQLTMELLNINLYEDKFSLSTNGVVSADNSNKLYSLKKKLANIDVESTIRSRGLTQVTMAPSEFYQKYIQAFIDQILSHGN